MIVIDWCFKILKYLAKIDIQGRRPKLKLIQGGAGEV